MRYYLTRSDQVPENARTGRGEYSPLDPSEYVQIDARTMNCAHKLDPKVKAAVVDAVLSSDLLEKEADIFSLEENDGTTHYQGVVSSTVDPAQRAIFSIPVDSHNVYITLTEGDPSTIRRAMATIEETEHETGVRLGNVLLLDASELRERQIRGVIFLPVKVSRVLRYLPEAIEVGGSRFPVLLVVFLRDHEHEVWRRDGHDMLMKLFSETDKDLVAF